MTLNALRWSRVKLSSQKDHPHYIPTFQIHRMDYPGQNFTKLKYNNVLTPIIWRNQFYLDPYIDFTSTWLYLIVFHHCIRNVDGPAPKHSELLASHYDDLRSERCLYLYTLWADLDSRVLSKWVTCSMMMYFYISSVCYTSVSTLLS